LGRIPKGVRPNHFNCIRKKKGLPPKSGRPSFKIICGLSPLSDQP
jgi:hypothetical protein